MTLHILPPESTYRLDAESRDLRDLESRGPWAVVSRADLLRARGYLNRVDPVDDASNRFRA